MNSFDYKNYWESIYSNNGNSGSGSYGALGDFKANVVKSLIEKYDIKSTIEFGCGDGNMVRLINYSNYIGFDISEHAVKRCKEIFINDNSKSFDVYNPLTFNASQYSADMVVCLDVLYHITIEEDFKATLDCIFATSKKLIVIYTKLTTYYQEHFYCPSIVDRDIYKYLEEYKNFKIVDTIYQSLGSAAHFLILKKYDE